MLFGLPAHPLLVHLTVVVIPLAALLAMVVAGFPRVPGLIKLTAFVLGALSVALVPPMESSGKALEKVPDSAAVEQHAQLGETLLPWVIGLLIAIVAVLAAGRWLRLARPGGSATSGAGRFPLAGRVVTVSVAVAAIAVAAGTLVQTVRIGHSGAQATWSSPAAATPGPNQVDRGEHGER